MRHQAVHIWLWVGVVMIFVQVLLGGITRLTGSGLSITRWEIVTGTLPPLNARQWNAEFDLYKKTPQYQKINQGMTLPQFKFIYFWEYLHRLWARSIGFVFLIPFIVFFAKGMIRKQLGRELGIAVLLGAVVATFGWIMVASGLENRPWVDAYKLTIHLNLALLLYAWMVWIAVGSDVSSARDFRVKRWLNVLTGLLVVQFILGGLMSGMKAGLYYPTWPGMYGEFFPAALLDGEIWTRHYLFEAYERGPMPGVVQFIHRMNAYLIGVIIVIFYWKSMTYSTEVITRKVSGLLLLATFSQVVLGILTVLNSMGQIPLFYGVAHQGMAMLILTFVVYLHRKIKG